VMFHHGVYAHECIPGAERVWIEEGSHLGFWLRGSVNRRVVYVSRHDGKAVESL